MNKSLVKSINIINNGVYTVEKTVAMIGLFSLVALISIQVVARYFLKTSTPWSEELARYVFIWTSYVGCGMCFAKKKHIVIDLIDEVANKTKKPRQILFVVEKFTMIASIVFLCFFLSKYWIYFMRIVKLGRSATALNLPMAIPYFSVIAGSTLMIWHAFVILVQPFKNE